MHLSARLLLPVAVALTIIPGLRTIAKAEPTSKPPTTHASVPTPVLAHPAPAVALPLALPRCARPAQTKILSQIKCKSDDSACICDSKKAFLTKLLASTGKVCSVTDQKAVKEFGAVYCGVDPSKVKGPPGTATAKSAIPAPKTCSTKPATARKTNTKTRITLPHNPTLTYECSPLPSNHAFKSSNKTKPSKKPSNNSKFINDDKKTKSKKSKPTKIGGKHGNSTTVVNGTTTTMINGKHDTSSRIVNGTTTTMITGKYGTTTAISNGTTTLSPKKGNMTTIANGSTKVGGTAKPTGMMSSTGTSARMENPLGGSLSAFGVVVLVGALVVIEWIFGEL